MGLGAALVVIGLGILYFAVTKKNPISEATTAFTGKTAVTAVHKTPPAASTGQQR